MMFRQLSPPRVRFQIGSAEPAQCTGPPHIESLNDMTHFLIQQILKQQGDVYRKFFVKLSKTCWNQHV